MAANETTVFNSQPVPELPVVDVERAQRHYRDAFGFEIGWLTPEKDMGAVKRGKAVFFLRQRAAPFEPAIHWVFVEDLDTARAELLASGAKITSPPAMKPWGIRQFTVEDLDGNIFYVPNG